MDVRVSYIVTVYDKAVYLPAVLAALDGEYGGTGGEIILVDDGSTDESPALLAGFAATRPYVTVIAQKNAGVAMATNVGMAIASCPYLRLVDADDVLVTGSTQALLRALNDTGCSFAFGKFATQSPPAQSDKTSIVTDSLHVMLTNQPFIPATTLGVTAIMQQALPLPTTVRTAQDFALGLRLASLTRFAAIDFICCISPVASGGLSASKARMFRDTALLARDIGRDWPGRYKRLAMVRGAGRARNYLRRHVSGARGAIAMTSLLAIATRVPFLWPYRRIMTYIAGIYDAPLAAIHDHP